jgi:hypothetical protein
LFADVQKCYDRFTEDPEKGGLPRADDVPVETSEFESLGPIEVRRFAWEETYSTAEYLDLLSSYSGHRALTTAARDGLYGCISALIEAAGGSITKSYLTQLIAANCLNQPLASG